MVLFCVTKYYCFMKIMIKIMIIVFYYTTFNNIIRLF